MSLVNRMTNKKNSMLSIPMRGYEIEKTILGDPSYQVIYPHEGL